ncbi:MAG TPA: type 4a pilus biogenesis protein PilO [Atribacteraceae bacterium]|nr:type 4a pilus biogenesis protein PilO [Atribacteraceae bacterium]
MNIKQSWPFILLGWAGGIVLAFFFILEPLVVELDTLQDRQAALEGEVTTLRRRVVNLEPLERRLLALQETALILEARLPEEKEIPDLLITIEEAAILSNVEIRSFVPQTTTATENYVEVPFGANLHTRYHDFLLYLNHLRGSDRLIQVRDFALRKDLADTFLVEVNLVTFTVEKNGESP